MIDFILSLFNCKRYKLVFVGRIDDDVLTFKIDEIFRDDFNFKLPNKIYEVFKTLDCFNHLEIYDSIECFLFDNTKTYRYYIYDSINNCFINEAQLKTRELLRQQSNFKEMK